MKHRIISQLLELIHAVNEAPTYHLVLEAFLFVWVLWLIFRKSYKPKTEQLTESEVNELIEEWQPLALVPAISESKKNQIEASRKIVSGRMGKKICINDNWCLNLGSHNYFCFSDEKQIETTAINTLRKYGCGSCGPRGFYGTVDIHLQLENKIAEFMRCEEAVLYSYGFSTVASAIPAYAKSGDIIYCDDGCHFAIQKGLQASRSELVYFRHNDADHLQQLLEEQLIVDQKNSRKAAVTRKFLVVEGLYLNSGDICDIKEFVRIKNRYKIRLFIDESCSIGVLGEHGRGITEHFDVDPGEVDLICATLEYGIASYGGFCCGPSFIVDHQRLSGLGYCYSASLPPLQAAAALNAIDLLESDLTRVHRLRENALLMHNLLNNLSIISVEGAPISPIKHLRFADDDCVKKFDDHKLNLVCKYAMNHGYALTVAQYLADEEVNCPQPSIRLVVNCMLEEEEIKQSVNIIKEAFDKVIAMADYNNTDE